MSCFFGGVMLVNNFSVDECMRAFVQFCESADKTGLVDDTDYQYWVYEQGYIAALSAMALPAKLMVPSFKQDA